MKYKVCFGTTSLEAVGECMSAPNSDPMSYWLLHSMCALIRGRQPDICVLVPRRAESFLVSDDSRYKSHAQASMPMQGWTVFHLASKLAHDTSPNSFLGQLVHCDAVMSYTDVAVGSCVALMYCINSIWCNANLLVCLFAVSSSSTCTSAQVCSTSTWLRLFGR